MSWVALGQPAERFYKVIVAPDHFDWTYKTGENVKFTISVLQNGNLVKNARIRYEVGPEKMEPTKKETLSLTTGSLTVEAGTMKTAGFCAVSHLPKSTGKNSNGWRSGFWTTEYPADGG